MLTLVPQLRGRHRRLLDARLDSIERLVADAEFLTGIEVVVVVEEQLDHVGVGVLAGDDAVVEVFEAARWATWFLVARPWVPVLICTIDGVAVVSFGRASAAGRTGS